MTITALPTIAAMQGANRILRGPAITSPCAMGREQRLAALRRALQLLGTKVEGPTVWEIDA